MDIPRICPHVRIGIHSFSFCVVSAMVVFLYLSWGEMPNGALTSVVSQLQQF